jgi:hypothetical protein
MYRGIKAGQDRAEGWLGCRQTQRGSSLSLNKSPPGHTPTAKLWRLVARCKPARRFFLQQLAACFLCTSVSEKRGGNVSVKPLKRATATLSTLSSHTPRLFFSKLLISPILGLLRLALTPLDEIMGWRFH